MIIIFLTFITWLKYFLWMVFQRILKKKLTNILCIIFKKVNAAKLIKNITNSGSESEEDELVEESDDNEGESINLKNSLKKKVNKKPKEHIGEPSEKKKCL